MSKARIDEALDVIRQLGFPSKQQNQRSALTLLALLDLKPGDPWSDASNRPIGITPMMDFFAEHYGKRYAPNSRETVRRQTVHQFLQAALIEINPDDPDRPTNSGKTVYRISKPCLEMLRSYNTPRWSEQLERFSGNQQQARRQQSGIKRSKTVSVRFWSGKAIKLSPGEHNRLVKEICEQFVSKFVPDTDPLYVGDTAKKYAYFDKKLLDGLGISPDPHGKIPDVIAYDPEKGWLFLIEAVTSHGPVDEKRRRELTDIFSRDRIGLVYVTAFADIRTMKKYMAEISWETEVWVADSPGHMIHFDGERFLGPHE